MCSRFLRRAQGVGPWAQGRVVWIAIALLIVLAGMASAAELKVCADPDAMPSSNRLRQGYDNKVAEVIARGLHAKLVYEWQRNGRGFVRDVLNKGVCDVVLGVPTDLRAMLTTTPYYRSTYVFVSRRDRDLDLHTFEDPQLKRLKIGVQVLSEEYAPPGQALGRHGLTTNLVAYETAEKPASIMDAVYRKQVDTAVVWGPLAGYYARRHPGQLEITPTPAADPPLPMAFSISLGVSKKRADLRDKLNDVLRRHKPEIDRILRSYGVPLLPDGRAE
jgi:mxaJ protein